MPKGERILFLCDESEIFFFYMKFDKKELLFFLGGEIFTADYLSEIFKV
jgi:hypothetical protein